jgi:uncharacterized protein (DUF58 family)
MPRLLYRWLRFADLIWQWLNRRFTPRGLMLVVYLIVAAAIGIDTNQSLAYQIFTFLGAILSLAIATSLLFRFRFRATRSLPRFGTVGLPFKYKIVLQNQNRSPQKGLQLLEVFADAYPSWQEFRQLSVDQSHRAKGWANKYRRWFQVVAQKRRAIAKVMDLPVLLSNRSTEVTVEVTPLRRGVLRFKGLAIACPDPLGLFRACRTLAMPGSILILPKLYQVPAVSLPGLRRYQSGGVALASSVGDSQEFRGLREYRPGDSPRKIDWKSWAKVGKPIVKEEQDEYFVRHALILDTFASEIGNEHLQSELLEEAISIAASFACEVQTQESLLDLMFVGLEAYCFTVGRGLGQTDRMLEILASVGPCREQSFEALMPVVMDRLSLLSGCICIFLGWDEARSKLVQRLEQMQIPTLALLLAGDRQSSQTSVPAMPANLHVLKLGQIQPGLMTL